MPITVRFKMQEGAEDLAPKKAHEDDAAWDLKSRIDAEAQPGKVTLIPTGLFLDIHFLRFQGIMFIMVF